MLDVRSICVYCGSSPGSSPTYADAATALGRALVERDLELVYGGAHVGLMGTVSDTVMSGGGRVHGVIPEPMMVKEIAHQQLTSLSVVDSMHARKLEMMDRADAFVVLPGGTGTLEELFETYTWLQLGLHRKPIGLLDVGGYWSGLMGFLDHAVGQGFVRREHVDLLLVDEEPARLLDRFDSWEPPALPAWLSREQA